MEGLDGGPAFVASEGEGSVLYESPLSGEPRGPDEVLDLLDRGVHQNGVNVGSAGTMAYIPINTTDRRPNDADVRFPPEISPCWCDNR